MPRLFSPRAASFGRSFLSLVGCAPSARRVVWLFAAARRRWPSGSLACSSWVEFGSLWFGARWMVPGPRGHSVGVSVSWSVGLPFGLLRFSGFSLWGRA